MIKKSDKQSSDKKRSRECVVDEGNKYIRPVAHTLVISSIIYRLAVLNFLANGAEE